jgi:hypothetical protein
VTLLTELDAFYLDHRRCGELYACVDGPVVWFDYECGASMARRAGEDDQCRLNDACPTILAWTAAASC